MNLATPARRRYESPVRAERLVATRARIVAAALDVSAAAGGAVTELPFGEVARRARVAERTVYRHFPTQRALGDAVVEELEARIGRIAPRTAAELPELARKSFRAMARHFGHKRLPPAHESFRAKRARRRAAIEEALVPQTAHLPPALARRASALCQLLTSGGTLRILIEQCGLDFREAGDAAVHALELVLDHLSTGARQ
jgi:AcrR family transcriptional regulator